MKKISLKLTSGILALSMLLSTMSSIMLVTSAEDANNSLILAEADFEDIKTGKIAYDATASTSIQSKCCSRLERVDESKQYYIAKDKSVEIVDDPETGGPHSHVVKLISSQFGISEHNLEDSAYNDMSKNYPPQMKFEFDIWKEKSASVVIRYGHPYNIGKFLTLNSNGGVTVHTESGKDGYVYNAADGSLKEVIPKDEILPDTTVADKQWVSYAIRFDVKTRRCTLYVDTVNKGSWILDDNWGLDFPDFTFAATGTAYVDNIKVSKDTYQEMTESLGTSIAVMNFGRNVFKAGNAMPINSADMVITDQNGSIAPYTFFENVLGATVDLSNSRVNVTLDGVTRDLTEYSVSYDNVGYLKLNQALTALGKNNESFDMVTIIGEEKNINSIKSNAALLHDLKVALNENQLYEKDITKEDWKNLKDKWRRYLLGDSNIDVNHPDVITRLKKINSLAQSSKTGLRKDRTDGIFALFGDSDIKTSASMTGQYTKLYYLASAYGANGSAFYHSDDIKADILYGLEWLYNNLYGVNMVTGEGWKPTSNNPWDWIVGVPTELCQILLIMEEYLTPEDIAKYLKPFEISMSTYGNWEANRIFVCTADAALREDFNAMVGMRSDYDRMLMQVESGNGVREDWMYITHKYFAYSSAYGSTTLLDRVVGVESILRGTKFEFATPYKYNSCLWMYETFAPIIFNGAITSAFSGRWRTDSFSEESFTRYAIGAMLDLIGTFGKDDDEKLKEIIKRNVVPKNRDSIIKNLEISQVGKLADILDNDVSAEPYYISRVYYSGDGVVHQKGDFGFALAMSSSRIAAWESIDGDNKSGWYNGDGLLLMHLKEDPLQYDLSYWKNVNPYHLPGTTVDTQKRTAYSIDSDHSKITLTSQDFVGGVNLDEKYSLAAMQLEGHKNSDASIAPVHNSSLMAKKAWFMFDDEVVALGSDIDANDGFEVETIVDNRKLNITQQTYEAPIIGAETITVDGKALEKVNAYDAVKSFENPTYANIENAGGYFFPNGGNLKINKINNTNNYLEMWFSHGVSPTDQTYSYVVLPNKNVSETEGYSKNPDIEILSNTEKVQSVREKTLGVTGTVFWEAGTFDHITVSNPMMVMTENKDGQYKVNISDPTQKLTSATVKLEGEYNLISCDSRCSVQTTGAETVITVDFAGANGRSLPILLTTVRDADTIASEDFEDISQSEIAYDSTATSEVSGKCCSSSTKVDATKEFYIEKDKSASVVADPENGGVRGKVVKLSNVLFGISEHNQKSSAYYAANKKLPSKLKIEFDAWMEEESSITARYGSASDSGRLMTLNANGGVTMYEQNPEEASTVAEDEGDIVLNAKKWIKYTVCLDTERKTAVLYADDEYVSGWTLPSTWNANSPDLTFTASGTAYIDNFKITEHKELIIEQTNPEDDKDWVNPDATFTASFNRELKDVDGALVTVTDGAKAINYKVSVNGNVLTISFPDGLELAKKYTVTFKESIESKDGITLGKDTSVSFETMPFDKEKFVKVESFDFEEITDNKIVGKDSGTVDTTGVYYIKKNTTVETLQDTDKDGNTTRAAYIAGSSSSLAAENDKIGISSAYLKSKSYSLDNKIMVEFDMKRVSGAAYLYVNGNVGMNTGEVMLWSGSDFFHFADGDFGDRDSTPAFFGLKIPKTGGLDQYKENKWNRVKLCFDFPNLKYYVYLNDEYKESCVIPKSNKGVYMTELNEIILDTNGKAWVDNINIYAYEELELESASVKDGATGVDPETMFTASFSKELDEVNNDSIAITGGTTTPNYSVSKDGKILEVTFPDGLELGEEYTITLKSNIKSKDQMVFGANETITFTTAPIYIGRYTNKIADFDFENEKGPITGKTGNVDTATGNTYYITEGKTVTIVDADSEKAALIGDTNTLFGVKKEHIQKNSSYDSSKGTYAEKVKVELRLKRGDNTGTYLFVNGKTEIKAENELMIWYNSGNKLEFSSGTFGNRTEEIGTYPKNEWLKIALYFDFETGKYLIFVEDEYKGEAIIPEGMTELNEVILGINKGDGEASATAFVDYLNVSAYEYFVLESTTPENGEGGVNSDAVLTAVFSEELGKADNSWVTVNGGSQAVRYLVSKNANVMTVKFLDGLELGTTYTVVLSENIKSISGKTLGENKTITFTTDVKHMPSGFTSVIADFNFENFGVGKQIEGKSENVDKDTGNTYYVYKSSGSYLVEIVEDKYGNAALIKNGNSVYTYFGVSSKHVQKHPSYDSTTKTYADKVKVEFRMKRGTGATGYMWLGKASSDAINEIMVIYGTTTDVDGMYVNNGMHVEKRGSYSLIDHYEKNKWNKFTFYFDFTAGKYYVFVDDVYKKEALIPFDSNGNRITQVDNVIFGTSSNRSVWVDDISVTTVPAAAFPVISEFRLLGDKQLGYNIVNPDSVLKTVKEIKARYNKDNVLVSTEVQEIEVEAKKSIFRSFAYPETLPNGDYLRYFVWDSFSSLKPLKEAKEVR